MTNLPRRFLGNIFSPKENALLDILCSGTDAKSSLARAQRATATWGGYEFDECECFLITVPSTAECPAIEHAGGLFSSAEVADDE